MFLSDNASGAHPRILQAIIDANDGIAPGYGADVHTEAAISRIRSIFETDCAVFLTPTGTAANALSLASVCLPWGAIICHHHAHIIEDEAGAPEFFTGGAKVIGIDGPSGKLDPAGLETELAKYSRAWVHGAQPFAVSVSNLTESGAAYDVEEIAALGAVCRAHKLALHMDGARFANAVISTAAKPADLTWKAGVDLLSFGATKNGALGVDAVVCFDRAASQVLAHLRKRAGHMMSKHRFLGAQMAAYLDNDLWLDLAQAANTAAAALADVLREKGAQIIHRVDGNEVFARCSDDLQHRLRAAGCGFYQWTPDGPGACRFVTAWSTRDHEIASVRAA